MLNIILEPFYTDIELEKRKGEFINSNEYIYTVDRDCNLYNTDGKLVFIFRKNRIPQEHTSIALNNLKKIAKPKRDNRGVASGFLDLENLSNGVTKERIISYNKFRVNKYIGLNGQILKRSFGNPSSSNIIGYYENQDRNYGKESPRCRQTSFTAKQVTKWNEVLGFINCISNLYKELAKKEYYKQLEEANKTEFHIKNTPFSTITVNYNWRTALHKDEGDFKYGLSAFTICQEGEYKGLNLGIPKYRICIDVREGDLLLFDPHEYHCNTELESHSKEWTRLSFVLYLREEMSKYCSNITLDESIKKMNDASLKRWGKPYI